MRVIWLGSPVNRQLAAFLKAKGYIDDYEANDVTTTLIIERDRVEIPFTIISEALETIANIKDSDRIKELWFRGLWNSVVDGKVAEIDDTKVVLEGKRKLIALRIPVSLKERLDKASEKTRRTITDIVVVALEEYLKKLGV